VRITAGILGLVGALVTLFVGVIFIFGSSISIGMESHGHPNDPARPDLTRTFREGGILILASAIALAFSVTLLCSRLRVASSVVLIGTGLIGLLASGWTAGVLVIAGLLGFVAARQKRLQPAV
jgi:hypothetical protein